METACCIDHRLILAHTALMDTKKSEPAPPSEQVAQADCVFGGNSGGAFLVASGSMIPFDSGPLEIWIPIMGAKLLLRLELKKDDSNKASRWEVHPIEGSPTDLSMVMFNLDAPLGGGPNGPVRLWTNPEWAIYLQLRIHTQGESPSMITFSFYRKPETPNEERATI